MAKYNINQLAKEAYEAYGDHTGWVNYQNKPMPRWDDLSYHIQQAWGSAVVKVIALTIKDE